MDLCDVTLREGDQLPDRSYSVDKKVEAGQELDQLGIPYLQPGFPVTGKKDQEVIRQLANEVNADVIGLARAVPGDVDAALDAEADIVEVFVPISDIQLEHTLDQPREAILATMSEAVDRVRDGGGRAHLTLADAFRAEPAHTLQVFEEGLDVEIITLADTVGASTPESVAEHLEALENAVDLTRLGVHFHDDLGVATANALEAVTAGVRKVDVSVASIGERAGNTALEEFIVASIVDTDLSPSVESSKVIPVCLQVLDILGEEIDPRKPVLGEEVTKHEAGLHTAAMLEDPKSFEPYNPACFGGERRLVFGEGTGRTAARRIFERAEVKPTKSNVENFLHDLERKGPIGTEDALALVKRNYDDVPSNDHT